MSNPKKDPNQTVSVVQDEKGIAGVEKYLGGASTVQLQGKPYTPAAIKAVLQAEIDVTKTIDAAKAAVRQQVADARPVRASARSMRAALRKYLLSTYGANATQAFDDFGIPVPKPGTRTAEAKALAQAKARVTRQAKKDALKKALSGGQTATVSTTPQK
jgi:hypothetical protein